MDIHQTQEVIDTENRPAIFTLDYLDEFCEWVWSRIAYILEQGSMTWKNWFHYIIEDTTKLLNDIWIRITEVFINRGEYNWNTLHQAFELISDTI